MFSDWWVTFIKNLKRNYNKIKIAVLKIFDLGL